MAKPKIPIPQGIPAEQFLDEVRAYSSTGRYVPSPLARFLFEEVNHRCTICGAPWLELHHIKHVEHGGKTEYDNLIVLCPNCHTRVHQSGVPDDVALRDYKVSLLAGNKFPIFGRISVKEANLAREWLKLDAKQLADTMRWVHIKVKGQNTVEESLSLALNTSGLSYLRECGVVTTTVASAVKTGNGEYSVGFVVQPTAFGIRWTRYLAEDSKAAAQLPK